MGWLMMKMPEMERRKDQLQGLLASLGIERVIAEANRNPVRLGISTGRRALGDGELRVNLVREVCHQARGVEEYRALSQKRLDGGDSLLGAPWPEDHVMVTADGDHHVALEAGDRELQLRKGHMVPLPDKCGNGGLHFLENVKVHTSATGSEASTQVEDCSDQPKSESKRVADCGATPCCASLFAGNVVSPEKFPKPASTLLREFQVRFVMPPPDRTTVVECELGSGCRAHMNNHVWVAVTHAVDKGTFWKSIKFDSCQERLDLSRICNPNDSLLLIHKAPTFEL